MKRLGVMGGTFDPLHQGHLVAASEVLHQLGLDRVMFVPAGDPWQKSTVAPAEDRFLMTVLGTSSHSRFEVSRIEIDRKGPTYTADTMETLHDFYDGGVKLIFIAGADTVLGLGSWEKLDRLAQLAEVVVVSRAGFDLAGLDPAPNWPKIHFVEMPRVEVSSTEIRDRVRRSLPIDYLVPLEVAAYISDHGLYMSDRTGDIRSDAGA
ncbi:MAG: nicotinate-nucleotide adenylyltransferase [Actinomycetota bacterium]